MSVQMRHQCAMALSDVYGTLQEWQAAEKIHQEFLDFAKSELDESDDRIVTQQGSLFCAPLVAQGREKEADDVRHKLFPHLDVEAEYELLKHVGNVLRTQGRLFDAKDSLEHALQISEGLNEDGMRKRHFATQDLSNVLCDLRDFQSAEVAHHKFLRSVEGQVEKSDPRVCAERYLLAWTLYQQGKDVEANAIYADLGSVFRRAIEDGTTIWSRVLDRLVYTETVSLAKTDETSLHDAVRMLNEMEKETSANKFWRSWWYANSSQINEKLGHKEEAIRLTRLFLEDTASDQFNGRLFAQSQLVRLLSEVGQRNEAEEVFRKAISEYQVRLGDDHVITNYVRGDLAELLMQIKKYAEAAELLEKARTALLSDPRVPLSQRQRIVQLQISLCEATGKPDEATRSHREQLENPTAAQ